MALPTSRPQRHIQLTLRRFKCAADVIYNFDIDCCQVAWTGSQVLATPSARRALISGVNVAEPGRRTYSYEARLCKYALRGFAVAVPGLQMERVNARLLHGAFTVICGELRPVVSFEAPDSMQTRKKEGVNVAIGEPLLELPNLIVLSRLYGESDFFIRCPPLSSFFVRFRIRSVYDVCANVQCLPCCTAEDARTEDQKIGYFMGVRNPISYVGPPRRLRGGSLLPTDPTEASQIAAHPAHVAKFVAVSCGYMGPGDVKEVYHRNLIDETETARISLLEHANSSSGVALPYDPGFSSASVVEGKLQVNSNIPSMVWDLVDATDDASTPRSVIDAVQFTFPLHIFIDDDDEPEPNGLDHPVVKEIGQHMVFSSSDFKDGDKRDEFGWFSDVYQ